MKSKNWEAGFKEVDHTSDKALDVWSPTLETLFEQAAMGMYFLMGLSELGHEDPESQYSLAEEDNESLLVSFLTELLFLYENKIIVLSQGSIQIANKMIQFKGNKTTSGIDIKPIKAVTFHELVVSQINGRWEARIVFDV